MLASLGLFVFELPTLAFDELQRRRDWRHEEAKRVGARSALQFTGPGEDTISLTGMLVPGLTGTFASLDTLVEMADAGENHSFVDGNGAVWGEFAIVALDLRRKHIMDDGVPRLTDFAIDLKRAR
jgi:phage protein U